jgi:dethiobiotin synthetase
MKRYFITGIGTNVGKTIVSAVLVQKLNADYWKPIQSGIDGETDTSIVRSLTNSPCSVFYKESYLLSYAGSPHYSALRQGVEITVDTIRLPDTKNTLIIEGAGGILVPINHQVYVIDLALKFNAEIILVFNNYLGSINHTLLSIEYLKMLRANVKGLICSGNNYDANLEFIVSKSPWPLLGVLPTISAITSSEIAKLTDCISI